MVMAGRREGGREGGREGRGVNRRKLSNELALHLSRRRHLDLSLSTSPSLSLSLSLSHSPLCSFVSGTDETFCCELLRSPQKENGDGDGERGFFPSSSFSSSSLLNKSRSEFKGPLTD